MNTLFNKIKLLSKNNLVRNTSVLAGGAVIAQIITVISSPILSRLYSPEDFGILGSILTIAGIISAVASLKYETAIVMSENKADSNALTHLSFFLLVFISIITFLLLWLSPDLGAQLGLQQINFQLILMIGILVFLMGGYNIALNWHNYYENYKLLSTNRIVQKISIVGVQLLFAVFIGQKLGLIYGNIAGFFATFIMLVIPVIKNIKKFQINFNQIKRAATRHYRFAIYSTPQNLLNSISQGLPVLMLGKYFSAAEVGLYFFSIRLLQLPSSIIGGSIRQVFYKRAADIKNNPARLKREFTKTTFGLLGIIIVPIIIIFMWGPELFAFIFGKEWATAGEFAKWMFLWVGLMFINPPSLAMYYILNIQKQQLMFEIVLLIARFSALSIGGLHGDILFTIKLYSIVGLAFNIIFIAYIFRKLSIWK